MLKMGYPYTFHLFVFFFLNGNLYKVIKLQKKAHAHYKNCENYKETLNREKKSPLVPPSDEEALLIFDIFSSPL